MRSGSVFLTCNKLLPSKGTVWANGGSGGNWQSAGGGGRIAIFANSGETNGMSITASKGVMKAASKYTTYDDATDGTVFFRLPGLRILVR